MPTSHPTYMGRKVQAGKRNKTYPAGRRCTECRSLLSIYNRHPTCRVHTPIRYPRVRGSVRR